MRPNIPRAPHTFNSDRNHTSGALPVHGSAERSQGQVHEGSCGDRHLEPYDAIHYDPVFNYGFVSWNTHIDTFVACEFLDLVCDLTELSNSLSVVWTEMAAAALVVVVGRFCGLLLPVDASFYHQRPLRKCEVWGIYVLYKSLNLHSAWLVHIYTERKR